MTDAIGRLSAVLARHGADTDEVSVRVDGAYNTTLSLDGNRRLLTLETLTLVVRDVLRDAGVTRVELDVETARMVIDTLTDALAVDQGVNHG